MISTASWCGKIELPGIGTASGFDGEVGRQGDLLLLHQLQPSDDHLSLRRRGRAGEYLGSAEGRLQPGRLFGRAALLRVEGRHAHPDVHRPQEGHDRPGADDALRLWRVQHFADARAFRRRGWPGSRRAATYAVANLRGGGEYGKAWHDAGRLANKQNVFDDFIAAGEYLKASGITGKDQLAIAGGSNGGLLVGAVVNQRPDLFAAASPAVGVMDMLRFDRFTAGRYWVDDYGYPNKEADFRAQYAYSPYHNIKGGRDYPAVLVTTADTDDRVVPGHSFKYIAALQAAEGVGDEPHLIRIETRAGHGIGQADDQDHRGSGRRLRFPRPFHGVGRGEIAASAEPPP